MDVRSTLLLVNCVKLPPILLGWLTFSPTVCCMGATSQLPKVNNQLAMEASSKPSIIHPSKKVYMRGMYLRRADFATCAEDTAELTIIGCTSPDW